MANRETLARIFSVVGVGGIFAAIAVLVAEGGTAALAASAAAAVIGLAGWVVLAPGELTGMLTGRQVRYGTVSVLSTALFIGVLVVLYVAASRQEVSADLTETQRYSLSLGSRRELAELATPIHIIGFYTAESIDAQEDAVVLLRQYTEATDGLITYEFIDPDKQPATAAAYEAVYDQMLFATRPGDEPEESEYILQASERDITHAILRLTRSGDFKVYFVTGHGEPALDDTSDAGLASVLQHLTASISVGQLNLLTGAVPEDADALVIAGATSRFSQEEVDALAAYLDGGGRVMILADPNFPPSQQTFLDDEDPLAAYLWESFAVIFGGDLVIPQVYPADAPLDVIAERVNGTHTITEQLAQQQLIFSMARTVSASDERPSGVWIEGLVYSEDADYAETNIDGLMENPPVMAYDASEDPIGPLPLALAVQRDIYAENEARLVLVGDAQFITNAYWDLTGNRLLFLYGIDWLVEYSEAINVEVVSDYTRLPVQATNQDMDRIALLTVVIMPGVVLLIGLVVWWSRRQG